jgi:transcriptional regulator with XRE-family HTH domain
MAQTIAPERLKLVRNRRRLTQEELARKAGLNKQTVYRIEKSQRPVRKGNLERLARALDIKSGVLTGEESIPANIGDARAKEDDTGYQLNVRLDGGIRNAFSLAALHYKVPVRRIVELAPLLFVLAAEGSLKRRRDKLAELEAVIGQASSQWEQIAHLPSVAETPEHREIMDAEKKSIAARDLFAEWEFGHALSDRDDLYENYNRNKENPFTIYLRELANDACDEAVIDETLIDEFSGNWNGYSLCWSQVLDWTGGDKWLAVAIQYGYVPIHEILREFELPEHLRGKEWTPKGVELRKERVRAMANRWKEDIDALTFFHRSEWMDRFGVPQVLPKSQLLFATEGDLNLAERLADTMRSGGTLWWREMPQELWEDGAESRRVEWLRRFAENSDGHAAERRE